MNKLLPLIAFSILLLVPVGAQDAFAVTIDTDLIITGEINFDEVGSGVIGNAVFGGTMLATEGGGPTSVPFDQNNNPVPDPLVFALTDLNDGFGLSSVAGAGGASAKAFVGTSGTMSVENTSPTKTFIVTFILEIVQFADAEGEPQVENAFGSNDFFLQNTGLLVFHSVLSDTFFGNEIDSVPIGGFGGPVKNSGGSIVQFTLGPGETENLTHGISLFAEALEDGTVGISTTDVFVTILNVEEEDGNENGDNKDFVVGGEIIPIDPTALLLAGVQTPMAWMMYAFGAIGIGAFLFTRNPNNVRNVKVILQDYFERFSKSD